MPNASDIVFHQRSRGTDRHGSGQFGAGRIGHVHQGLDIVSRPGEEIRSPIEGDIVREAYPYGTKSIFRGVVIRGTGDWAGYEVKLFYVEGLMSGRVSPGLVIGHSQDLTQTYPGITNHVHMEVRQNGRVISPQEIYGQCF